MLATLVPGLPGGGAFDTVAVRAASASAGRRFGGAAIGLGRSCWGWTCKLLRGCRAVCGHGRIFSSVRCGCFPDCCRGADDRCRRCADRARVSVTLRPAGRPRQPMGGLRACRIFRCWAAGPVRRRRAARRSLEPMRGTDAGRRFPPREPGKGPAAGGRTMLVFGLGASSPLLAVGILSREVMLNARHHALPAGRGSRLRSELSSY